MIDILLENKFLALLKQLELIETNYPTLKSVKMNFFEAAGLVRQEIRHSKVLAYLLSPSENHGLRDAFFKKIINHAHIIENISANINGAVDNPSPLKLALGEFDDLVVRREDMQIDILAWSPKNKLVFVLENKVDASESLNQLGKYREKINNDYRFRLYKKIFIFLTLEADQGSDLTWINVSYRLILECLEALIEKTSLGNDVQFFISHYIELLRKYVMNEENEELKSSCLALYEKHKDIFDLIYKNIDLGGSKIEAINLFRKNYNNLIFNKQSNSWLSFNPTELTDEMPNVLMTREWHNQNKPIVYFFNLYENQIKIVIEVGPISNLTYRNQLVERLFKKIKNQEKAAKSDTYTRIYTSSIKLDTSIDDLSAIEIFEKMNQLYKGTQEFTPKIKEIFQELKNQLNSKETQELISQ